MKKITLTLLGLFFTTLGFAQERSCATMNHLEQQKELDPTLQSRMDALESFTQLKVLSNKSSKVVNEIITIPVVVHVIYNTNSQNISDAQIQSQITVLTEDFRRNNADADNTWSQAADTQIEFALATIDPNGNATTGITRTFSSTTAWEANDSMKFSSNGGTSAWDSSEYLNMWVCPLESGLLGYAQFPGGSASTDGVVIAPQYFGSSDYSNNFYLSSPFDKGRTTTHEVGHFLNLRHIWGDGGCGVDDFVSDTPTSDASNGGCVESHTSCGTLDMVQNYMDYSDDSCMNLFTAGQTTRMRTVLEAGGSRRSLALSDKFDGSEETPDDNDSGEESGETGDLLAYCDSNGGDSSFEWIDFVSFAGISNSTTSNGGYADFTSQSATVSPGSTNQIVISAGFASTSYTEFWAIWIDYNQNGTFENSEKVVSGSSSSSENLSASITIPSTATLGSTTMRVSMKYDSAQTACESFSYGEVEDYAINITNSARTTSDLMTANTIELGNETAISLSVYPNPSVNSIEIKLNSREVSNANYKIINIAGQSIKAGALSTETIDVSNISSGLYILEVNDGQKILRTKLIKN